MAHAMTNTMAGLLPVPAAGGVAPLRRFAQWTTLVPVNHPEWKHHQNRLLCVIGRMQNGCALPHG